MCSSDLKSEEQKVVDESKVAPETENKTEKPAPETKKETVTRKIPIQLSGTSEGTTLNFAKDPNVLNYTVTVINPATGKVIAVLQNYQPGQAIPGIEPGVSYLISLTKTGVDGKVTTSLPSVIRGTYAPAVKATIFGLTSSTVSIAYKEIAGTAKYRIFITNLETGRLVRAVESTKLRVSLAKLQPETKYTVEIVAYSQKGSKLSKKESSGVTFTTSKKVVQVKRTITCASGSKRVKVTGVSPKCPVGLSEIEVLLPLGAISAKN